MIGMIGMIYIPRRNVYCTNIPYVLGSIYTHIYMDNHVPYVIVLRSLGTVHGTGAPYVSYMQCILYGMQSGMQYT